MQSTKTPCIGICSTTSVGDAICRGCKRYDFEVIGWNNFKDDEKRAVLHRIEKLNTQIIEEKLRIFSVPSLREGLKAWQVPFDESLSPYCWLHNLLKKNHRNLDTLEEYGVYVRPAYAQESLSALCEMIDREILILCEAHYQRYIAASIAVQSKHRHESG